MEKHHILGYCFGNNRPACRSAFPQCHDRLCTNGHQTAPGTTGLAVPGGMDGSVRTHGSWCWTGCVPDTFPGERSEPESDGRTVGGQFLLVTDLFQCRGLRFCLALATASAGVGDLDDTGVWQGIASGRLPADSVYSLAAVCRISQCGGVVS